MSKTRAKRQDKTLLKYPKTKYNKIKITTADKWFSIYIRIRDCYPNGYGRCCTCRRKPIYWKEAQCGHYMTRNKKMTRFHEKNAHFQCKICNGINKGEQGKHGIFIDKKYGAGTAEMLVNLSEIRGSKLMKLDYKKIANEYRVKAKNLAERKGVIL